jgi:glycosyltransferase involved in cell wall biosynthesis
VLVGSGHMAGRLWDLVDLDGLREKTRLGPPGVDVHEFGPKGPDEAARGLRELADRLEEAGEAASWGGEAGAAGALRSLDPATDRIVSYVGKLIVSKGVDLLVAAWPLVVREAPEARLVVVGFGTYRDAIERLVRALAGRDLEHVREVAARGRELEGGEAGELKHLAAFLDGLDGPEREAYLDAAPAAAERIHLTGRLEHGDLADLLPACEAQVVPSTFPEAFGMVAAEAAACGALPLSARHSGLAEVTAALAEALDEPVRDLLSFEVGPGAVEEIAEKLVRWLRLDPAERGQARERLAELARGRYSWEGVAKGLLAGAQGRLDELPEPGEPAAPLRPSSG